MRRLVVYHERYNIRVPGARLIHPFDGAKYGKAFALVQERLPGVAASVLVPEGPVDRERLAAFVTPEYLERLGDKGHVCEVIEAGILKMAPMAFLEHAILEPMRWAVAGTALAARRAIEGAIVFNLGGGYHHASHDRGEGFCLYNDLGLAVGELRRAGLLGMDDEVGVIDLDAHHGNGNARTFLNDSKVVIMDVFNAAVYPTDPETRARVDYPFPMEPVVPEDRYLEAVRTGVHRFFAEHRPRLVFYNAGTDPYRGDRLGGYAVSERGLVERDRLVVEAAAAMDVPLVGMTSGGYSDESWRIVGESLSALLASPAQG